VELHQVNAELLNEGNIGLGERSETTIAYLNMDFLTRVFRHMVA